MNGQEAPDREDPITVFWDIDTASMESCEASTILTYDVVSSIRTAISIHGVIKTLRAYYDFSGTSPTRAAILRSELSSSGVMLIDCPGEGRKGAATKRLLVDLMCHAWDNSPTRTICIITGDRDIAYAIATLRMRKYNILLMAPAGSHPDLTSQVLVQMDWTRSILGINGIGSVTDRANGPEKPLATPQSQGLFLGSSHAPPATAPLGSRFKTTTTFGQTQGAPKPSVEMYNVPSRGRRDSVLSKSYGPDYNVFGSSGDVFMSPPPIVPSFGVGEGPPFPRPQSRLGRASRSDSAPPNIFYPGLTPRPHFEDTVRPAKSKGKERAFPLNDSSPTPNSSSFQPFAEDQVPVATQASSPPDNIRRARAASVLTSSSTSSSGEGSPFSVIQRPEASTAPTSADHLNDDEDGKQHPPARVSPQVDVIPAQPTTTAAQSKLDTSPPVAQLLTQRQSVAVSVSNSVVAVPSTVGPEVVSLKAPQHSPPPVQPEAAPTSTNAPSQSRPTDGVPAGGASSSLSTTPPAAWAPLVNILRKTGGSAKRSDLGSLLLKANPNAYNNAGGFGSFRTYIDAAVRAGVVRISGSRNNGHVDLIPPYLNC